VADCELMYWSVPSRGQFVRAVISALSRRIGASIAKVLGH